jgi:prephenate dehydratase
MLAETRIRGAGAIASDIAAKIYHGNILAEHLEDHRENCTRFLLLVKATTMSPKADKTSLFFSTPHVAG